jgi:two-component system NtrC family sensor kinase
MNESKNRRVLVIDDNRGIHDDFRKILSAPTALANALTEAEATLFDEAPAVPEAAEQYEVDSAYQGREGLDRVVQAMAKGRPYAMAYIDVRMPPGWDGIETTAQIWKVDPELQVVICTAHSDYSWNEMIAKLGRSDRLVILKKPFENIEVSQLTQAITEKWQLLQQTKRKLEELEGLVQARTRELTASNQHLRTEIAERKHLEQQRLMIEVQLRQAQKLEAIGQLAAGIAHEINTPVQYVGDNTRFIADSMKGIAALLHGYKEMARAIDSQAVTPELLARLKETFAAHDVDYFVEQIPRAIAESLEGVARISSIVRAMKEFSYPGGKEKTPANLNQAIQNTVTVAAHEWKYVAEVKLDLDSNLPLVPCFVGEFNQCVLNLIVNAAHAIEDAVQNQPGAKGLITIRTQTDGDHAMISVGDTGSGIPEPARPHIFEPFFTTKGVGKGTGQGLSIVYSTIVKKHGGTVTFETESGQGTCFTIRLPLTPAKKTSELACVAKIS